MMPAGTYWVGDLCYVLNDAWDQFCDLTIVGNECKDGEFALPDGRKFATYSTKYGDGYYRDNLSKEYGVDAGLIGCILLSDIDQSNGANDVNLGHVHTFNHDFNTSEENGVIHFDHVTINTDWEESESFEDEE